MPARIDAAFTTEARSALRAAIADAGGNEVYFLGTRNAESRVDAVRVLARGNRRAVPALLQVPRPGEVVIHNHPSGELIPSDADLDVASTLGNDGVGFYIVDNAANSLYVVVEPHVTRQPVAVSPSTAAALAPGGLVAGRLEGYEHRPQQMQMLAAVAQAFEEESILTVEAGTGTGKSLAYLLPAISWSLQNQERVIVSTHTINLQEQLISKDLPFLTQFADLRCTTALVKGRGNYLCKRKARQAEQYGRALVEDDQERELQELLAWSRKTQDGSLSDLPVRPRREVWEQVVSEEDNCLRARCDFYSSCFFYEARRAAAKADVIVVNHHLLMADLALRDDTGRYTQNAILPPARRVIVDEAHHLEDVATNYFGARLGFTALERSFGRLRSARTDAKGVLPALLVALESLDRPDDQAPASGAVRWIEERLLPARVSLLADAEQCFAELYAGFETVLGHTVRAGVDEKIRVVDAFREQPYWQEIQARLTHLATTLSAYAQDFDAVLERIEQLSEAANRKVLSLATELRSLQARIAGFALDLQTFVAAGEESCRWIEARNRPRTTPSRGGVGRGGPTIAFHAAPIDVGSLLRGALFERFPTVVLTSATLAVDRRFDYLHRQLGLDALSDPSRLRNLRVESPFDFAAQALLAVPGDLPEPNDAGYESATHAAIAAILGASRGGTFVLFTAYGALNRAAAALGPLLRERGLTLLQQGETNRQMLLARFVADPRAVLFATDSFWEGVDVRGDDLRCVVIARLPFRVPTEPIEQARVEAVEARGGNAFVEHSVPQAVIKLKQGFGRLIRARTDRGAVVLLDSRVARKTYGRIFLDSLPPARRLVGKAPEVYAALRRFFGER